MSPGKLVNNHEVEIYASLHPSGCCDCFLYSLPCPQCQEPESECCETFTNIGHQDGPGGYTSIPNILSVEQCCSLCRLDGNCQGWTLTGESYGNTCFLYNTPSDGVTPHDDCISGNPNGNCPAL